MSGSGAMEVLTRIEGQGRVPACVHFRNNPIHLPGSAKPGSSSSWEWFMLFSSHGPKVHATFCVKCSCIWEHWYNLCSRKTKARVLTQFLKKAKKGHQNENGLSKHVNIVHIAAKDTVCVCIYYINISIWIENHWFVAGDVMNKPAMIRSHVYWR